MRDDCAQIWEAAAGVETSAMRKRSSRCNSDTFKEQQMDHNGDDISLLQRPLRTAHTGFEEARRAYEDGTREVSFLEWST